jgi:hypothetical protein
VVRVANGWAPKPLNRAQRAVPVLVRRFDGHNGYMFI